MSSKEIPASVLWTCDRCHWAVQTEKERPASWARVILNWAQSGVGYDLCNSCSGIIQKEIEMPQILSNEPYPGATETTMGGR